LPVAVIRSSGKVLAFVLAARRRHNRARPRSNGDARAQAPPARDHRDRCESPASLAITLPYFDREARLEVEDIAEQIEVYQALRLVAPALKVDAVLDRSFVPSGRK